ncbi:YkgJ family cysteine cluster protein [Desulforamulus aquiferis]|uniref:YkgJ family cysteine cluster protein n=1 Tax=Desulforamulus aquiferis TaxID=1397668 RepID=A0AAW7ZII5_9FIRM|nr:YkgJ family cysteine cluster protein [Desulforamulus aquiferis]MDO7788879.1 YkgJ family cysteine cluster protein [Desulforamulus aquiferis]RYD06383.1 hypothetical protein N752_04265 [Desulforamulus aquiferis]
MSKNLKANSKFKFSCHEQLECFKKCCRDINIFLTPLDVLRMKNKLGMSSGEFLIKHTHILRVPSSGFPVVVLKMREEDLVCPFISEKGCMVYHERPWSCRMAPVEIRGADEYGFAFEPSRCHGLKETKEWTVKDWMDNQGLRDYEEPEKLFGSIPTRLRPTGHKELDGVMMDMLLIGCYDLDKFRNMLMYHNEFTLQLNQQELAEIMEDDLALMKFAFKWLPENLTDTIKLQTLKQFLNNYSE